MLFFRWDEVAPILRGMYARQLDGFGQERAEPAVEAAVTVEELAETAKAIEEPTAEAPAFHTEPVTVYPGEQNHLPYDVVVERLHVDRPGTHAARTDPRPDAEPGEKPETPSRHPDQRRLADLSPTRGRLSRRPTKSTKTTCAATPRISISVTTIWARAAPRPSTRPMSRRSSC